MGQKRRRAVKPDAKGRLGRQRQKSVAERLQKAHDCLRAQLPTRPRKPRDNAKVEVGVLVVERWILVRLRNWWFFSLAELNQAIAEIGPVELRLIPVGAIDADLRVIRHELR